MDVYPNLYPHHHYNALVVNTYWAPLAPEGTSMAVVSRPVVQLWAGRAGDESLTAAGVAFRNVLLRPVAYIGAIAAEPVGVDAAEAHII